MIARLWHGVTSAAASEAYARYLVETGIRDTRATPGNAGVLVLRRVGGGHAEFLFTSFWESPEAIRRFAGADLERAVYYPRDREFLEALEPAVTHYEVIEPPGAPPAIVYGSDAQPAADLSEAYRRILRLPA
jgi:heme-degrading monooxygenase HmoA